MPPSHRIVDLTQILQPGMRGVDIQSKYTLAEQGWNASTLHLYSHCGTHMDAPYHFGAGHQTIDQIPLDACCGPAWVIDLTGIAPQGLIQLTALDSVRDRVLPGDSLLLRTGWSAFVNEAKYRDELPRIADDLAQWCVTRQIRMLGVEPPSVANVHNLPEVTRIHRTLLEGGVVIVEGLTHLDALQSERVFFMALPLKPAGGDGSPARALAIEGTPPDSWFKELAGVSP